MDGTIERPNLGDVYGDYLFHGDELQGLSSLKALDPSGIIGTSLSSPDVKTWIKNSELQGWTMDPLAIDVAFQLGVVWSEKVCGSASLPVGFASFEQYAEFQVCCEIRFEVHDNRCFKADRSL